MRRGGRGRPQAKGVAGLVDWRECERAAAEAAVAAGRLILPWAGRPSEVTTKSSPADLVTEMDRQSEALIRQMLLSRFPEHGLLGEEGGGRLDRELVWHVDPIDGTTNFVHGLPGFCVSIGLCQAGRPVVGAVYDPVADELFSAAAGHGALLNGRPLRPSPERRLAEALLGTGFPPVDPGKEWSWRSSLAVSAHVRNLRNLGSAALHLCYVAAGRLSGFWESGLNSWDVAAAVAILREAGGRASSIGGEEWHAGLRGCVGTNGGVHDELLAVLARIAGPQY